MSPIEDDPDVLAAVGVQIADDEEEEEDEEGDEYEDDDWEEELSMPPPPDGGFGWVIVVASLFCNIIVDGVCFSFGIFNVVFIEKYGSSKSEMAWVGSLLAGFYLTMGPITAALCNRYGCRIVTVVGSFLCCIAFVASTFATTVGQLIFTYGALGGITFGLVYLPALLIVNFWFEKRRALASGLAVCGSGIGAFVFAPLSRYLLTEYGLQGANWIIAGIILNGCVCGALFRPVEEAYVNKRQPRYVEESSEDEDHVHGLLQRMAAQKRERKITLHDDGDLISGTGEYFVPLEGSPFRDKNPTLGLRANRSFISQKSFGSGHGSRPSLLIGSRPISLINKSNKSLNQSLASRTKSRTSSRPASILLKSNKSLNQDLQGTKRMKVSEVDISKTHNTFNQNSRSRGGTNINNNNSSSNNNNSSSNNNDRKISKVSNFSGNPWGGNESERPSTTATSEDVKLDRAKDLMLITSRRELFFAGSMNQIPYIGSRTDIKSNIVSMHSLHHAASRPDGVNSQAHPGCGGLISNALTTFVVMMDLSLLKSPVFDLLCVSSFFSMTGFFVPFFYIPSYTTDLGLPKSDGDFVLQMIGVANTVARIASGYLADLPCVDALVLNNIALVLGGVSTMLIPFCTTKLTLSIYGLVFGCCIAVFVSLRTLILAELLGRERLASSFGLFVLFQGIASIIGSPIAGMVYDKTKTYDATFYFAGGLIALSGLLLLPIRLVQRYEERQEAAKSRPAASGAQSSAPTPMPKARAQTIVPDIVLEEPTDIDDNDDTRDENERLREENERLRALLEAMEETKTK